MKLSVTGGARDPWLDVGPDAPEQGTTGSASTDSLNFGGQGLCRAARTVIRAGQGRRHRPRRRREGHRERMTPWSTWQQSVGYPACKKGRAVAQATNVEGPGPASKLRQPTRSSSSPRTGSIYGRSPIYVCKSTRRAARSPSRQTKAAADA